MTDPDKIKHLEMVQAIVTRMASNSFLIKGWSLTVVTGTLAFALEKQQFFVAVLAVLPCLVFWYLDGYFLAQERSFRGLYNEIRATKDPIDFSMSTTGGDNHHGSTLDAMGSRTLLPFYGMLCLAILVVCVVASRFVDPVVASDPWKSAPNPELDGATSPSGEAPASRAAVPHE